jgi:hypothetical protein
MAWMLPPSCSISTSPPNPNNSPDRDGADTMAHYLMKNADGEIKHITGKPAMLSAVTHGWKVIEQWFGR